MGEQVEFENLKWQKGIKIIIRVLVIGCFILGFCPYFLVSCSGKELSVSTMDAVVGVRYEGERVSKPYPLMIIIFLIPIGIFVLTFLLNKNKKVFCGCILAISVGDFIFHFVFRFKVKELAEISDCEFNIAIGFVMALILIVLTAVFSTALLLVEENAGPQFSRWGITGRSSPVSEEVITEKGSEKMIYCTKCGARIDADSVFCDCCGERV